MTQKERLQRLKYLRNPELADQDALDYIASRLETIEVEPEMPKKGIDYFTEEDINNIASIVRGMIKDGVDGEKGEKGDKGDKGDRGEKGDKGADGRDGETPNMDKIVSEVLSKIPKPADGKSPDTKQIVALVLKEITLPDNKNLVSKDELVAFLKKGGFRGGGDTVEAGSNITITINESGQKVINAAAGGTTTVTVNSDTVLTVTTGTYNVFCDATTQAITITLPTAVSNTATINIKKIDATANTVTINCTGAETIDGDSTQIIQFENTSLQLVSDSSNWRIV